jgi:hypothetical protein
VLTLSHQFFNRTARNASVTTRCAPSRQDPCLHPQLYGANGNAQGLTGLTGGHHIFISGNFAHGTNLLVMCDFIGSMAEAEINRSQTVEKVMLVR